MMSEKPPLVGRDKIAAVVETFRGRSPRVIQGQQFRGDESGVQPVSHQVTADRSNHKPRRADRFSAVQSDLPQPHGAANRNCQPGAKSHQPLHFVVPVCTADFCSTLVRINCARSCFNFASEGWCTYIMWPAS